MRERGEREGEGDREIDRERQRERETEGEREREREEMLAEGIISVITAGRHLSLSQMFLLAMNL